MTNNVRCFFFVILEIVVYGFAIKIVGFNLNSILALVCLVYITCHVFIEYWPIELSAIDFFRQILAAVAVCYLFLFFIDVFRSQLQN